MKRFSGLFSLLFSICLLLNSCSAKLIQPNRLLPEKMPKLQEYDYTKFNHKQFLEEIKSLNEILSQNNISENKYEDILNCLELLGKQIKIFQSIEFNRKETSFTIPPNGKTILNFKSYCLNGGRGSPAEKEQFILRKNSPDIPLYKDIMTYTNSGKETMPINKQHLLWNLKNNVKFENLPLDQQAFLLKMDPMSYMKVNNLITSELKSQLTKFVQTQAPLYNQAAEAVSLVKGKAHKYEDYARNIENIVVKAKLIDNTAPIKADGYDIFTQTQSSGYSGTKIIFFNINAYPISIACTAFLDPFRPVQPIGFDFPKFFEEHEKYEDEILSELDKLLLNLWNIAVIITGKDNYGDYKSVYDNIKNNKIDIFYFLLDGRISWNETEKRFGKNSEESENDAFRHALWSALMTLDIGAKKTEEFTTNHEIPIYQNKGREMDLHNNRIGRQIAIELLESGSNISRQSIIDKIIEYKDKLIVKERTGKWEK